MKSYRGMRISSPRIHDISHEFCRDMTSPSCIISGVSMDDICHRVPACLVIFSPLDPLHLDYRGRRKSAFNIGDSSFLGALYMVPYREYLDDLGRHFNYVLDRIKYVDFFITNVTSSLTMVIRSISVGIRIRFMFCWPGEFEYK